MVQGQIALQEKVSSVSVEPQLHCRKDFVLMFDYRVVTNAKDNNIMATHFWVMTQG